MNTERLRAWARDAALGRSLQGADQDIRQAAERIEALEAALREIADRAAKLHKGTDDWFELVEFEAFEAFARAALGDIKP